MENQKRVACPENEDLATYMLQKRRELAEQPKGISDKFDLTLQKAYSSVCNSKTPIQTLKEFSQIKGVGKWILRLMKGFFQTDEGTSEPEGSDESEGLTNKGKKTKGTRRYVPQKNSAAYALLITLYRGTANGSDFMRKQEIIDAAEASGLSRAPIAPEKGKGKPGSFGSSSRDWYSGWSCMKTLITKGLVVRSSNPAKYMLTAEGQEAARECIIRSGLVDSTDHLAAVDEASNLQEHNASDLEFVSSDSGDEVALHSVDLSKQKKDVDVPLKSIERFTRMGYSKEQVLHAFNEIIETSEKKEISLLWPAVLCRLREEEVYGFHSEHQSTRVDCLPASSQPDRIRVNSEMEACGGANMPKASNTIGSAQSSFTLKACSSYKSGSYGLEVNTNSLAMPPLSFGENFQDAYEVILILDDREQFATQGSRSRKIIENILSQFKIQIEVRRLPVGDGIWIARHKYLETEYVLDFIVERKNVDDLRCSIRDNRYRDQKLRLVRCGLKKLIYLVEGDLNSSEAADSIKTACFTTEILEGFDVQRTSGLGDTLRKYGYLTQSITHYYRSQLPENKVKSIGVCPPFDEFIKRCQDMDKMTVGDVFAIQLMQVPQVTEEIAIAILDLYPTLLSLARAYALLEGDVCAQEEMLWKQSNYVVTTAASRNIFQLVWSN